MTPEPIPDGDLGAIIECGLFAPSAGNRQPWHFLVVTNRDLILKIAAAVAAKVAAIMGTMASDRARKSFGDYNLFMTFFENSSALILAYVEPYQGLLERLLARYAPDVAAPAGQTAAPARASPLPSKTSSWRPTAGVTSVAGIPAPSLRKARSASWSAYKKVGIWSAWWVWGTATRRRRCRPRRRAALSARP